MPWGTSKVPHVLRSGAYEGAALVLLYGMADPAYGSSEGEERDGSSLRQSERAGEDDEAEVDGGTLAQEVIRRFHDGRAEGDGRRMRARFGRSPDELRSARVALGVERVPKARHAVPPTEATGDNLSRLATAAGGLDLPQEGLDELDLPTVPNAPERREARADHGVGCRPRRGHAPGGEGGDGELVIGAQHQRNIQKLCRFGVRESPPAAQRLDQARTRRAGRRCRP